MYRRKNLWYPNRFGLNSQSQKIEDEADFKVQTFVFSFLFIQLVKLKMTLVVYKNKNFTCLKHNNAAKKGLNFSSYNLSGLS